MKKLLLILIIGITSLSANSSEDMHKEKNAISHAKKISVDEANKFKMRSEQAQKETKCGAAKCGSTTTSSKCGAVKIPTH